VLLWYIAGCVFSWGDGDYGKLGRGGSDGCKSPKPVDRLDGEDIIQVGCGTQFSAALSSKGRVFTWGKGDGHRLGHGTEEHVRYPKRVEGALLNKHVISLSVGCMHCAVVTEDGEVYCWGRNDRSQQGDGSTNTKTIPTLVGGLQDTPMMKVACGAHQTFVWSTVSSWGHGVRAPFCIDVKQSTFQFLDVLLKQVCTGLDKWHDWRPPRQEQECMAVAGLNLLGLQLHAAIKTQSDIDDLGLTAGSPLASSLKQLIVTLATNPGVVSSVQTAAQSCLNRGWVVLLPTAEERARTLSELLPKEESVDMTQVPAGRQFMIELLVNSLMSDGGLEVALDTAIQVESISKPVLTTAMSDTTIVPLLQLVEQLLSTATMHLLVHFTDLATAFLTDQQQLPPTRISRSASLELLLRFQHLLFGKFFTFTDNGQFAADITKCDPLSMAGALTLLQKYTKLFCASAYQVIGKATQLAREGTVQFIASAEALEDGLIGVLLPELVLSMILLQAHHPSVAQKSEGICLLRDLLIPINRFNQLAPGCYKEDELDMTWLRTVDNTEASFNNQNVNDDVPLIRKEDLENHNKEGGLWIVIHGCVYNAQEFKANVRTDWHDVLISNA
jgi:E3 ubiquitin-protein ligase HERC2